MPGSKGQSGHQRIWLWLGVVLLVIAGAVLSASFAIRQAKVRQSERLCAAILSDLNGIGVGDGASAGAPSRDADVERLPALNVEGVDVVGRLQVSRIGLDIPIAAVGNDASLIPRQVSGRNGELIVCGSSYQGSFGRIDELSDGDEVTFTQVNGLKKAFEVTGVGHMKSGFDDDYALLIYYEDALGEKHWVGCSEAS